MINFKSDLRQRCFDFSLNIIALTNILPNKRSGWVIGDQLLRSATSVGANLMEAKGASSRLDFKRYFEISLKSAHETKYWLELLKNSHLANQEILDKLLTELNELMKMISTAIFKLKSHP